MIFAESVREAVAILGERSIDVLMTDLMMPEVSGQELIRYTREKFAKIAIVAVTGYPEPGTGFGVAKMGADAYLTKPVSIDKVKQVICELREAPQLRQRSEGSSVPSAFRYHRRLKRLRRFVLENIDRQIQAFEAAAIVGLEPKYFSTWFRRATGGLLWTDWLAEQRIREAERQFAVHNLGVLEAGLAAGFGSEDSFRYNCKRLRGMTPSALKAAAKASGRLNGVPHDQPPETGG